MQTISYAITACNEHVELDRLLYFLVPLVRDEDEIVIQLDTTATEEVKQMALVKWKYAFANKTKFRLNNDFASFKNNLSTICKGDFIFQIDADELPSKYLIENLPAILDSNLTVDVYAVPRINTVSGLLPEHINKWGWKINEMGYINFPDYQWRIYRNVPTITWVNKVHEKLTGHKAYCILPSVEHYCLSHHKNIERQVKQNDFYDTIG